MANSATGKWQPPKPLPDGAVFRKSPSSHQTLRSAETENHPSVGHRTCAGSPFHNSVSERIEPGQQIGIALPVRRFCGPQFGVHLFQSLPFHLKARLSVMVCGVEMNVSQPASNHCDVHSGGDQMNGGGVAEYVRRNALPRQRRRFASCCFDVLAQPESETGSGERFPITIDEYSLVGSPWMSA